MTSEVGVTGFGLAHVRPEGGHLHPDDPHCTTPDDWSEEKYKRWYKAQIKRYEDQFKDE